MQAAHEANAAVAKAEGTAAKKKTATGMAPPAMFASCTSLTPAKVPGLLLELRSTDLRLRMASAEAMGVCMVRPFLHFLELRHAGIFFEMYPELERQRKVLAVLARARSDRAPVDIDALRPLNGRLARALESVIAYGEQLEAAGCEAATAVAMAIIIEQGNSYGDYFAEQFAEWDDNPALRLGCVGAPTGGPQHAAWLVEMGKPGLRLLLGKVHAYLH